MAANSIFKEKLSKNISFFLEIRTNLGSTFMNIAEICLNSSLGGLELYFLWTCQYFATSKHKLFAVTLSNSRLEDLLKKSEIQPLLLHPRGWFWTLKTAWQLAKFFETSKINIAHVHFAKDLPVVVLAKILSRQKIGLVHTRQMEMPGNKKDLYHRWLYSHIDLMICITDKLKKDVLERTALSTSKVVRLYYGAQTATNNLNRLADFRKKFPSTKLKVGMFSRLEKSKGQWRLLKVLAKLHEQGLDFQIYFFGHFMGQDGYQEFLQKLIHENHLEGSVYWCGFQDNPTELMSYFDVIVLPSDQETFGLVLIEAMAAGVSVVGSRSGGVPEIIDEGVNGFTFEPESIDEFAQKMKLILGSSSLRDSFVKKGREKQMALFNKKNHYEELEKFFLGVIPH